MAAGAFSADRDTKATPRGLGGQETPSLRQFLASFHTFLLAAIGHMVQFDVADYLQKRPE